MSVAATPGGYQTRMTTASYHARERRLVLENIDSPHDARRLADAIAAFADPDRMLVLDLTHVPWIPAAIAAAAEQACRDAEARGCRVHVWSPSVAV